MRLIRASLLSATVAGIFLASFTELRAEPVDGLYVGAGAGYNFLQDVTPTVDALPGRALGGGVQASAPMKVRWGDGYAVTGSVGWGLGNGVRFELEGSYRSVQQAANKGGAGGQQTQVGVMANALYDADVGLRWVSPYVGIGLGYQAVTWGHVTGQASGIDAGGSPTSLSINQTLGSFAYQVIVGLAFPVEAVPGLSVTAEYRYMNLAGSRSYSAVGSTPGVSGFPSNTTHAHVSEDGNHTIMIGLRYAFGMPQAAPIERPPPAPEPATVPAPAAEAAPARTYLVFFDWDSAALTPRARDIIAEAVRSSAQFPHTRIDVAGHADRTGSERGNIILSRKRAEVVAAELQRSGVPGSAIDIHAYGDTKLLVPTAAGIRQSENRRVEIVYR
jgi:OmpA-OmpF porin, OOP family